MSNSKSLTFLADGRLKVLKTNVQLGAPAIIGTTIPDPETLKPYVGIWDTGASVSAVSEKIIRECGLKAIGMIKAHGADGEYNTPVFLASLILPNKVWFLILKVTRGRLPAGTDMLIGMDVIGSGDFAVTHHLGRTCITFRVPSVERIDFTGKLPVIRPPPRSPQAQSPSNPPPATP